MTKCEIYIRRTVALKSPPSRNRMPDLLAAEGLQLSTVGRATTHSENQITGASCSQRHVWV